MLTGSICLINQVAKGERKYHCGCLSCIFTRPKQESKKEMNGHFVSAISGLKCIIKMVNIFLIYIGHFMSSGKQTSRWKKSKRFISDKACER